MALAILWSSLPTILKLSRDNSWPVMLWWSWMGEGASHFLWTFLQMFCLIPQCSPLHSPPCHTWICRSFHSSVRWCLYSKGVPGGPWWCCLLWNAFHPHVFCRCSCSSHSCLGHMRLLCRACCCCLCRSYSYWSRCQFCSYFLLDVDPV